MWFKKDEPKELINGELRPLSVIDIDKNGDFVTDIEEHDQYRECIELCPVGAIALKE